jgi:hypothetical protein
MAYTKDILAKEGFYLVGENRVKCFCCQFEFTVGPVATLDLKSLHDSECNISGNEKIWFKDVYARERDRLRSFLAVSFDWPVDVYKLAKEGFYYDTVKNSSSCYACKLQIAVWSSNDSAKSQHSKYNCTCPFFVDPINTENVPLGEESESIRVEHVDVDRIVVADPPRHYRYKRVEDRIASFSAWPVCMRQKPEELASAGFFYSSRNDTVICFQCGRGLCEWAATDRPWEEHVAWFPDCPLVVAVYQNCPARVNGNRNTRIYVADPIAPTTLGLTATVAKPVASTAPTAVKQQTMYEENMVLVCKVCLMNPLEIVFLPCTHMTTCSECATQLSNCPICRSTFTAHIKASFSPFVFN